MEVSEMAGQIDFLNKTVHWFMLVLFVGWGAFMVFCLWRFRRKEGVAATYEPVKGSLTKSLEVGILIFEVVLLVALSMPAWAALKHDFPDSAEAFNVRVVAQQFTWYFHYPGEDGKWGRTEVDEIDPASGNPLGLVDAEEDPAAADDYVSERLLHIPVNKKVILKLTSQDVIHSFGVHRLRVKQDVVPGESMRIWFESNQTSNEIREWVARTYRVSEKKLVPGLQRFQMVTMEEAGGFEKGTVITADVVAQLKANGVDRIKAAPEMPVEIACSQLCGLNHYSMRGWIIIESEADVQRWLDEKRREAAQDDDDEDYEDDEDDEDEDDED